MGEPWVDAPLDARLPEVLGQVVSAAWLFFLALPPNLRVTELCLPQTGPLPHSRRARAPSPGPSQPSCSPRRWILSRKADVFRGGLEVGGKGKDLWCVPLSPTSEQAVCLRKQLAFIPILPSS